MKPHPTTMALFGLVQFESKASMLHHMHQDFQATKKPMCNR